MEPYTAVGISSTVWGVRKRKEIMKNIEHLHEVVAAASWLSSLDLPVRLIAIPEGALQGFTDEVFDMDHVEYALNIAIEIPGEETDRLADIARQYGSYVIAQAKAVDDRFPNRFFNNALIIDPHGKIILKHYKNSPLFPVEHSICPHDIYEEWVRIHGRNLQAFFPVVETDIGVLGCALANEGSYPEYIRGLALNGAEVVYRPSYPHPHTQNEFWEIQNRARALDNNLYIVAPNTGTYYLTTESPVPIDTFGGKSMIVDYKGRIIGKHEYGAGSSYCAGVIDIDALRDFRSRSLWANWMKDLRTEIIQIIYERELYPKNLWINRMPMKHKEYEEKVIRKNIERMFQYGIWRRPVR